MQYVPQLPHPARALAVPLAAAALGAGVATATFAVVNIEDQPSVSLPTPAVQSAPPSDAVAGERNDGGPAEGTAQQAMRPATELRGSKASATAATVAPRYDGGPQEGSSANAIQQPGEGEAATPFGGTRP
jgi:hypothetical protein